MGHGSTAKWVSLGLGVAVVTGVLGYFLGTTIFDVKQPVTDVTMPVPAAPTSSPASQLASSQPVVITAIAPLTTKATAPAPKITQEQIDPRQMPPITLSVRDASLPLVASTLNNALHTTAKIQAPGTSGQYTLDMKEKPFWEVLMALHQQGPFVIAYTPTGMRLTTGSGIKRYAIDGPVIAFAEAVNYRRATTTPSARGNPPVSAALSMAITIAVDPRVKVSQYQTPRVISAVDDQGHNLAPSGATRSTLISSSNQVNQTLLLAPVENMGKTFSVVFESGITAVSQDKVIVIHDLQNNLNLSVAVGNRNIRIARFDVVNGTISYQFISTPPTAGNEPLRVDYALIDGTGKSLLSNSGTGSFSGNLMGTNSRGPFNLELRAPDKTVDFPVRFEMKDIPLQ